jgi:hypothetical protein
MFTEDLDELEVAILLKRLEIPKAQGITSRRVFSLGDDFFALMKDKWIFDGVLSTIHGFQEMHDEGRDEAVGATLEPALIALVPVKKKRGRKSKKELAEMQRDVASTQLDA